MTSAERPAVIVAATPTSNGDLHLGHIAGPYLSGDVYARYLRAIGRPVTYTTCTDDSQSYVVTTARAHGTDPETLCATATASIAASLTAMGISIPGLPPIGERYRDTVRTFVRRLHSAGKLKLRTVRMPVARTSGTVLYDGLLSGTCPACLAGSSGGGCEACGHPNHFDQLLDPVPTAAPDDEVVRREYDVLVLPLEDYRDRLTSYYADRRELMRPHARQLVDELLARPLPDLPVTVPGTWGTPAPFPEVPGQVLYPWVEAMPAVMYSTWWANGAAPGTDVDAAWRRENDAEVVYFHGYDNVYFWGLVDLVLLMAHDDRYVAPAANVCNEFYELDGLKFSTSRNHLVWTRDLLVDVPRDVARFYLALTAPEFQRTSFTHAALHTTATARLVRPWNELADAVDRAVDAAGPGELPTTAAARRRAGLILDRFRGCYELSTFSMGRAAGLLAEQVERLRAAAGVSGPDRAATGDLLLEVRAVLAGAAPLLIDVAEAVRADGADLSLAVDERPAAIRPFRLPKLSADRGANRAYHIAPVSGRA